MIRYFSTEKELRGVEGRIDRERITEKVDFKPVCVKCFTSHVETLNGSEGKRLLVSGVLVNGKVHCFPHAFALLKADNPDLTDLQFRNSLKPHQPNLVQHLYEYDAAPVSINHNY
jgi:hypothetical protein